MNTVAVLLRQGGTRVRTCCGYVTQEPLPTIIVKSTTVDQEYKNLMNGK